MYYLWMIVIIKRYFFQVFKSYLRKKTHYIRYKIEKVAVNLRIWETGAINVHIFVW